MALILFFHCSTKTFTVTKIVILGVRFHEETCLRKSCSVVCHALTGSKADEAFENTAYFNKLIHNWMNNFLIMGCVELVS